MRSRPSPSTTESQMARVSGAWHAPLVPDANAIECSLGSCVEMSMAGKWRWNHRRLRLGMRADGCTYNRSRNENMQADRESSTADGPTALVPTTMRLSPFVVCFSTARSQRNGPLGTARLERNAQGAAMSKGRGAQHGHISEHHSVPNSWRLSRRQASSAALFVCDTRRSTWRTLFITAAAAACRSGKRQQFEADGSSD